MGAFDTLRIAASGLGMHQTWLDAVAHNLANTSTMRATSENAFQAQMLVVGADPAGGVEVTGLAYGDAQGEVVLDPDHPLADEDGYVRAPAMDQAAQMSQLIMAQRGFQASAQVTKFAQDTYGTAIQIGNR
ncbi:MAG: flagellar basal body rod C-terminal domain-containing protein [Nocardioides sp.]